MLPRPILAALLLVALAVPPAARATLAAPSARFYAETGYTVVDDRIWDFFQKRGGVRTFGYPISRQVTFLGLPVQFFQRGILQLQPTGSVTTMNLLDEGLMPYTRINGSTFPAPDPVIIAATPTVSEPDYGTKIIAFVQEHAPDTWNGLPVNFYRTFLDTVRLNEAFPDGGGSPDLLPLLALEIWGAPTSRPAYDPNNHNFVYLRFQRGIMHYDATTGRTQGLLLADYLKAILTGQSLPADLEAQAQGSRFLRQYNRARPAALNRPQELAGTDLTNAFEREDRPLPPIDYAPNLGITASTGKVSSGGSFTLTLTATDDQGVRSLNWSALNSGDAALDALHTFDCGSLTSCTRAWTVTPTREGTLTLEAYAVDSNNQASEKQRVVVTVENSFRSVLEEPRPGVKLGGTIKIAGWVVDLSDPNGTGIQAVQVYLDGPMGQGSFIGTANYGEPRPDVATTLGHARFTNSGFTLNWNSAGTPLGQHTLYVYALSRVTGIWTAMTVTLELINISFPDDPSLTIESPLNGQTVGTTVTVGGWAVDRNALEGTGVDAVHVYLDGPAGSGLFLGAATYGQARPDVGAAMGDARFNNSGFALTFSTSALRAGDHTLYVYARSALSQAWKLKTVTFKL